MREDTTMTGNRSLKEDPSSVQVYLTIMQGVILRMAENSRSCQRRRRNDPVSPMVT
jgi:hypothetical protein